MECLFSRWLCVIMRECEFKFLSALLFRWFPPSFPIFIVCEQQKCQVDQHFLPTTRSKLRRRSCEVSLSEFIFICLESNFNVIIFRLIENFLDEDSHLEVVFKWVFFTAGHFVITSTFNFIRPIFGPFNRIKLRVDCNFKVTFTSNPWFNLISDALRRCLIRWTLTTDHLCSKRSSCISCANFQSNSKTAQRSRISTSDEHWTCGESSWVLLHRNLNGLLTWFSGQMQQNDGSSGNSRKNWRHVCWMLAVLSNVGGVVDWRRPNQHWRASQGV